MKVAQTKTNIFAISALGLFVLACFVLAGMWYVVSGRALTLDEALTTAAVKTAEENQMARISEVMEASATDRELLKSFILDDTEVINFISHLESVAQSRGLSITTQNVTTGPIEGSVLFEKLNLDLQISGNKKNVMEFVSYVELLPYQALIPNINLQRSSALIWSANFELHVTKTVPHE